MNKSMELFSRPIEDGTTKSFVTVDYDEMKPDTYRGIVITLPDESVHRVNTGDFKRDWRRVVDEYQPFLKSSTVDNFISDANIQGV